MIRYPVDANLSVIPYTGIEAFHPLKGDWDRLAANNGSYFPFLCYDWFVNWMVHFPDTQLHIPVLYSGETVVAIMPMMSKSVKKRGVPFRTFAFAGNAYTQARGILHDTPDIEKRIFQAGLLLRYFVTYAPGWDFLDLYGLQPENGNSDQIIQAASSCGLQCAKRIAYENCYQDNINLSADDFLRTRPFTARKNAPRYYRKMQREGKVEFRFIRDYEDLDLIMDSYYRLYARSWKKSEGLGPSFHRDLVRLAANKGWLRLGFLLFNSEPIACQLWFVHGETAFVLKLFYDEEYKRYSPGTVLSELMLRTIMDQDHITILDYLQGDDPYKRDWVDKQRTRDHLVVYNKTIKGRLLGRMETSYQRFRTALQVQ